MSNQLQEYAYDLLMSGQDYDRKRERLRRTRKGSAQSGRVKGGPHLDTRVFLFVLARCLCFTSFQDVL